MSASRIPPRIRHDERPLSQRGVRQPTLMDAQQEEWRPVIGYEGHYEISNRGHLRRVKQCRGTQAGRILNGAINPGGYVVVTLGRDNKKHMSMLHRLVAEAFIGPRPDERHEINHKDGNKQNNTVGNLEWVTRSQNNQHAYDIGLRGPRRKGGRLTREQAIFIRTSELSSVELAERFGVSRNLITCVQTGITWNGPDMPPPRAKRPKNPAGAGRHHDRHAAYITSAEIRPRLPEKKRSHAA